MEQTRYHRGIVRFIVAVIMSGLACSSHPGEPRKPSGSATPPPDATEVVAPAGPSERQCSELFAHALALHAAEAAQARPGQAPTADELAKAELELRDQFLAECRASTLDGLRCAMAATTPAALAACQATPSSSTSNSSVAPGGITPAAPLSP